MEPRIGLLETEELNVLLENTRDLAESRVRLGVFFDEVSDLLDTLTGAEITMAFRGQRLLFCIPSRNTKASFTAPQIHGTHKGTKTFLDPPWQVVSIAKDEDSYLGRSIHLNLVLARKIDSDSSSTGGHRWKRLFESNNGSADERSVRKLKVLLNLIFAINTVIRAMNVPNNVVDEVLNGRRKLPWERVYPQLTVTISFDIRSSTFLMNYAVSDEQHARWLHCITEVMRSTED